MDAVRTREDTDAIVGALPRRRAGVGPLPPADQVPRMPSLAALVDAVYRFDLDLPPGARGQTASGS